MAKSWLLCILVASACATQIQGPQGEPGPVGPQGPAGPQSPAPQAPSALVAVIPNTVTAGTTTRLTIFASGTNFDGDVAASAGDQLVVRETRVISPTALEITVVVPPDARPETTTLTVTSGTSALTLPNALRIELAFSLWVESGPFVQGGATSISFESHGDETFAPELTTSGLVPKDIKAVATGFDFVEMRWTSPKTFTATALLSPTLVPGNPVPIQILRRNVIIATTVTNTQTIPGIATPLAVGTQTATLASSGGNIFTFSPQTVPVRLAIQAVPSPPSWQPVLRAFSSAGVMLDRGAGELELTLASNEPIFIVVNDIIGGAGGPFSLLASATPLASNATCSGASPLALGSTTTNQQISSGGPSAAQCGLAREAFTRFYSLTLAGGEGATIRVTPSGFDARVRVVEDCAATACIAATDTSLSPYGTETLSVRNPDAMNPRTLIVAVGSSALDASGTFSIAATRQSYKTTTIPTACEDMDGGIVVVGVGASIPAGDSVATDNLDLPFPFWYFGTQVYTYSATTNGIVGLFVSPLGPLSSTSVLGPGPFPSSITPNAVIAPYSADLDRVGGPTGPTLIQHKTLGLSPNRTFVLEWCSFAPYASTPRPERLRFQVKLKESSNAVEFHYCDLNYAGGIQSNVDGSNATIGIEDFGGTDSSVGWSNRQAGAVGTSLAIVFKPIP